MAAVNTEVYASAYIKNGQIIVRNRREFDANVRRLKEGIEGELAFTPHRATRSLSANAFYWGVVIEYISQQTGYHPGEVHDLMKMLHLPKALAVCDGNGVIVGEYVMGGSTRNLNASEFYEYVERVRQWAAETLCLDIPDPNENYLDDCSVLDEPDRAKWYRAKRRTA
jgi:hypothetical protein